MFLCDDERFRSRRALGYRPADGGGGFRRSPLYSVPGIRADGGLCSTARALVALPQALRRTRWLSEQLLDAMLRPTRLDGGVLVDYGIGARLGSLEGLPLWGHTGGMTTYWSTVAHYPDADVTIAVLVNTDGAASDALVVQGQVARAVFGLDVPRLADLEMEPAAARKLAGVYGFADESIEIVRVGSRLQRRNPADRSAPRSLLLQIDGSFGYHAYPMDRIFFHWQGGTPAGISEYHNGMFATYRPAASPPGVKRQGIARR